MYILHESTKIVRFLWSAEENKEENNLKVLQKEENEIFTLLWRPLG